MNVKEQFSDCADHQLWMMQTTNFLMTITIHCSWNPHQHLCSHEESYHSNSTTQSLFLIINPNADKQLQKYRSPWWSLSSWYLLKPLPSINVLWTLCHKCEMETSDHYETWNKCWAQIGTPQKWNQTTLRMVNNFILFWNKVANKWKDSNSKL